MENTKNTEEVKPRSLAKNSFGYVALFIGGLIAKFSLVMWLGIIGYTLLIFGLLIVLASNE